MSFSLENKKLLVKVVIVLSVLIFGVVLYQTFFYYPSDELPLPKTAKSQNVKNNFTTLSIPKIGVDAKIVEVGITKKGNMASPENFSDVGWYKYGTIPGEMGSAVIAGHVDNGLGLGAVFSRLGELKEGDDIYVLDKDGKQTHFLVKNTEEYNYDARAEKVFNDNDGKFLKLVTCSGKWIDSLKTHNKRLIVSAVLVEND